MISRRSALEASGKVYRTEGISRRVRQINISAIKEMPLIASKLDGCVSLGQGIPSFETPGHIVDEVFRVLRDNMGGGKYTLGPGLPRLRAAVAEDLAVRHSLNVDPDREICITVGAMEALSATMLTVVDRGDEVLLPSPNYASHIEQVLLAEGIPVFVPLKEENWHWDVDALRAAVTPRTKAIVVCNPHNPTGANFTKTDLEAIADIALRHGLFVISDETYDFLVYDGKEHFSLCSIPELKDQLIATFSFSKKYAMTGWRVGYVYACEGVLDHIMKIHDAMAICAPTVSQYAALAALEGPQDCVRQVKEALEARRDLICKRLDAMKPHISHVKPAGAYYLMARYHGTDMDSLSFALKLLHEARVITIPGAAFGPAGEHHIRMSFGGTEAEINEAADRMERWLQTVPAGSSD